MNHIIYLLICIVLVACNNTSEVKHTKEIDTTTRLIKPEEKDSLPHYTEQELEGYLDSIGHLPTQPLVDSISYYPDSIFYTQAKKSIVLSQKDFGIIKNAVHKGIMNVKIARRIFEDSTISDDCNRKDIFTNYK